MKIHFFLARFARKCNFFYAIAAMLGVKTYKCFPSYRYSNLSIHNTHADIDAPRAAQLVANMQPVANVQPVLYKSIQSWIMYSVFRLRTKNSVVTTLTFVLVNINWTRPYNCLCQSSLCIVDIVFIKWLELERPHRGSNNLPRRIQRLHLPNLNLHSGPLSQLT